MSLHAIANDARSSSLDMHPSPAVSGERQGLVKERKKNGTATRSRVVGQTLELLLFRTANIGGGRPLWTTSAISL